MPRGTDRQAQHDWHTQGWRQFAKWHWLACLRHRLILGRKGMRKAIWLAKKKGQLITTLKRVRIPLEPFPIWLAVVKTIVWQTLCVQMDFQLWVSFESSKWQRKWWVSDLPYEYKHSLKRHWVSILGKDNQSCLLAIISYPLQHCICSFCAACFTNVNMCLMESNW